MSGEAELVRKAIPARQREFALGRSCARRALAQLGYASAPIGMEPNRAPSWPAGAVGSITHCRGFVGAIVAPVTCLRGLGFDAEASAPLGADLVRMICTPEEIAWMRESRNGENHISPKVIFSAKEAVHKCIAPIYGVMLDFREVVLLPEHGTRALRVKAARSETRHNIDFERIRVRFALTEEFVFSSAFIEAERTPAEPGGLSGL